MSRGKTLPFVFRCPDFGAIIKSMDCNKKMQEAAKTGIKIFSKYAKKMVIAKGKESKHS